MAAPPLRWGVIGPGWIAQRFVTALQRSTAQRVVAAASRDPARAEAFARDFGIETAYGSYEQLLSDPGIDVAYIATPHNAHHPCTPGGLGRDDARTRSDPAVARRALRRGRRRLAASSTPTPIAG